MSQSHKLAVNGVHLHVVEHGAGPLVLMLHGFPDIHRTWKHQVDPLVRAGFRVVTPDLRGYNLSDKPERIADYDLNVLADDVVQLIAALGAERAYLVGHDWGGVIAWHVAKRFPERIEKLVIINAPHPAAYRRELKRWPQLYMSWYTLFFQLPVLPEIMLSRHDFQYLENVYRRLGLSADEIAVYKQAFSGERGVTAPLNYYRAAGRRMARGSGTQSETVSVETLVIWGLRDRALNRTLLDGLESWVPRLRIERIADGGHWVHLGRPEVVNRLLVDFLNPAAVP